MSRAAKAASPVLETARLQLDWLTLDDADLMLSVWNDARFIKHVADRGIRTLKEAEEALQAGPLKLYENYGYGPYRVSIKETGEAIGTCGLFKRDYLEDPDIGFALLPDFSGAGLGWESADCVLRHARDDMYLPRLTAIVSPANAPSIGLITKLGMQHERNFQAPGESSDVSLYGINWSHGS
tara:strand:- start:3662 stop:4207 length:546 start_codon:yes stop_codon:yes gene_type:complete